MALCGIAVTNEGEKMRSSNATLNDAIFNKYTQQGHGNEVMTLQGVVNRTLLMLLIIVLSSAFVWSKFMDGGYDSVMVFLFGGLIGGLIFALITIFKKEWAPVTAPAYAVLEGLFLGGISAFFESMFPGIVLQAVALTFGVMFSLLFVYKAGIIKVTDNFRMGIVAATGGILIVYVISFILSFFGARFPFIHEGGIIGIGFSLFVVTIAALNLVLDFDFIENASKKNLPPFMEWYAAFGLVITLVWLYIEILHLLAKLRNR